jgi:RND superfamily putative drug exporter
MFARLGDFVTRHWLLVIVVSIAIVAVLRFCAPRWDDITHDGDFAYLPSTMPSVAGERWMSEAFPRQRAQSQIVVVIAREDRKLDNEDIHVAYDLGRRFKNLHGASRFAQADALRQSLTLPEPPVEPVAAVEARILAISNDAKEALQEAIHLDRELADYWSKRIAQNPADEPLRPPRLAAAFHNLALVEASLGNDTAANEQQQLAEQLDANLTQSAAPTVVPAFAVEIPLLDTWTWHEDYFGDKLVSSDRKARTIVLQLSSEFMEVGNIGILKAVEQELDQVREGLNGRADEGLVIALSGSAAVGADMLRSAAASIQNTERFTVVLVILILALVYRSPMLVVVPLVSIVVALLASMSLVALLTQLSDVPGFSWWTLKVFSTTRIFVVVILFGAGTDYCLFLISRYKEELRQGLDHAEAVSAALAHTGDALLASALTTVLGLSMMFFADFGKFCYSGPVIGLCLTITLITCVTLTPAIMRALGSALFWPFDPRSRPASLDSASKPHATRATWLTGGESKFASSIWHTVADLIVTRPGLLLVVSVMIMLPLAGYGAVKGRRVTYDFLSGLPAGCPSKMGTDVLRRHYPVGESGPVTVLVRRDNAQFGTPEGRERIRQAADHLLRLPGVQAVRSAEDPLGQYGPDENPSIVSARGRRLRVLRAHPRTKAIFVAQVPELEGNVARFELILDYDPFSLDAVHTVGRVEQAMNNLTKAPGSFWQDAEFALAGTTAAIRDLRTVTRRDNVRIQILVVLAVFVVLLVILRRPAVCAYMMLSVLFSYYVTLGITTLVFSTCYGPSYQGLDWKVPLFLFVILVAIGQDYNVYLATRVFEEQRRIGPFAGLRHAVVQTGGIITSCGVIMAGTFISMTSGTWAQFVPVSLAPVGPGAFGVLRSIVELGFALALGVLLDTLVVRPILLPAFLALICRYQHRRAG